MPSNASVIVRAEFPVGADVLSSAMTAVTMAGGEVGGMLTMRTRAPVRSRDDLSMAYTPGVARVCIAIHDDPERAWDLTIKGNSVMVVSDGSKLVGSGQDAFVASGP